MISIYCSVWATSICIALTNLLSAQEDKANADKLAPIARQLAGLHNMLSVQRSLSLVALESGHVEPGFGHDGSPRFTGIFKLFYKGDRFLYNVEFIDSKAPTYNQVESFDGEHYAHLNRNGGIFSISSQSFVNDVVMSQGHVMFMPFLFLQSRFSKDAFPQLSYRQLTNEDDWRNVLTSIPSTSGVEEVTVENQKYLKVTKIGKNVDPVSDQPCVFDVFFAKRFNWYPMKWERRLTTGKIVTSYSVEELGFIESATGEDIPYPKVSVLNHYQDSKLRDTERIEVKQIRFDSVSDGDLSIDPASASLIRDIDRGINIKVPK